VTWPQLFDTVSWPLDERHGLTPPPARLPGWVITAEAAAAIPEAGLAVEMAADQDPQAVLQGRVGAFAAAARGGRE
jgi:hypothetical protein